MCAAKAAGVRSPGRMRVYPGATAYSLPRFSSIRVGARSPPQRHRRRSAPPPPAAGPPGSQTAAAAARCSRRSTVWTGRAGEERLSSPAGEAMERRQRSRSGRSDGSSNRSTNNCTTNPACLDGGVGDGGVAAEGAAVGALRLLGLCRKGGRMDGLAVGNRSIPRQEATLHYSSRSASWALQHREMIGGFAG